MMIFVNVNGFVRFVFYCLAKQVVVVILVMTYIVTLNKRSVIVERCAMAVLKEFVYADGMLLMQGGSTIFHIVVFTEDFHNVSSPGYPWSLFPHEKSIYRAS
ncbi:hypothetical protein M758_9G179700 [Ceratodon purpureus]|uniref:Uncharacterized protein n=1 Tax=Ceratodon purpureus TaxID=3225 RepID=A0A8T0H1D6_CERPU|nr:hypothetical protein KC19_9G183100 [Ceratodon purpureus]KAG0606924.1 hypothetical protein M758_9G179700 [Ceratodon purpureus]